MKIFHFEKNWFCNNYVFTKILLNIFFPNLCLYIFQISRIKHINYWKWDVNRNVNKNVKISNLKQYFNIILYKIIYNVNNVSMVKEIH